MTIRTGAIYLFFFEYFHGDNGAGLGASHQTGWTGARGETPAAERRVILLRIHGVQFGRRNRM